MNDFRIDQFLGAVRNDLGEFFTPGAADERMREMRGHLEEAIAEKIETNEPDPVGSALAEFGNADGYRLAAQTAGGGILVRQPEREVVKWAAYTLLIPIGLDLAMDFSAWITGSDSDMWAISVPLVIFFGIRFAIASTRSKRFLAAPLMSLIVASFTFFWILGGWTRATDEEGSVGSRTRGTAYRRRQSLIEITLPEKKQTLAQLQSGAKLFSYSKPTPGIGEFRTAEGYLVPTIPADRRKSWKGDPAALRWLIDDIQFEPVASYAEANKAWQNDGPELLRFARLGVEGEQKEIEELGRVVSCPWKWSVAAQADAKVAMGLAFGFLLLLIHGVGVAGGAIVRNRRKGTLA